MTLGLEGPMDERRASLIGQAAAFLHSVVSAYAAAAREAAKAHAAAAAAPPPPSVLAAAEEHHVALYGCAACHASMLHPGAGRAHPAALLLG